MYCNCGSSVCLIFYSVMIHVLHYYLHDIDHIICMILTIIYLHDIDHNICMILTILVLQEVLLLQSWLMAQPLQK